ncbi:MAG: phage baseplate protein [Fusobacterium sp.]|uniref:phage baseplate protein n=1 Tax=Fusobacterium sp. TaxID=68766 RepID=UPI003993A2B7
MNSLYISLGNENPSSLWLGTTWQKQENRFLLGAGSSYNLGATGGNANISLGINNIPRHRHKVDSTSASIAAHSHPATVYWGDGWNDDHPNGNTFSTAGAGCTNTNTAWTGNGGGGATGSFAPYTDYQGNGSAFSIMPPYIAVNIWKRTS